jgi:hypothetical protein
MQAAQYQYPACIANIPYLILYPAGSIPKIPYYSEFFILIKIPAQ